MGEIAERRNKEILDEWHRHPGLGPSQIKNQLRRKGIKTSVNTVRRVMEEAGYRPPKVERKPHDERYEATRPNHLWHLDFVHRNIHKANTFTLILIDDFSRYVVGHGVDESERADFVIAAFEEVLARIEAGAGRDAGDLLDLRERCLELGRAVEARDRATFAAAFNRAAVACNGCHAATSHSFIEIPGELGTTVPKLDPLPPGHDAGPM